MIDYDKLHAQWAEHRERLRKANNADRETIFDALTALGITQVDVTFDGYADSGQIIDVSVSGACDSLTGQVTVTRVPWDGPDESYSCDLAEAVEDLCYALLEQEHPGWQDNDGAHGNFAFDVSARTVTLDCHVRYLAYSTSEHVFIGEA